MGIENLTCYRCEKPGHIAAECLELRPAETDAEHEQRIARYVERWINGEITTWQKREFIRHENKLHGDGKAPASTA